MRQKIYLGLSDGKKPLEVIVNLVVEENNRDDVKEVMNDAVDRIYDGEYEDE